MKEQVSVDKEEYDHLKNFYERCKKLDPFANPDFCTSNLIAVHKDDYVILKKFLEENYMLPAKYITLLKEYERLKRLDDNIKKIIRYAQEDKEIMIRNNVSSYVYAKLEEQIKFLESLYE